MDALVAVIWVAGLVCVSERWRQVVLRPSISPAAPLALPESLAGPEGEATTMPADILQLAMQWEDQWARDATLESAWDMYHSTKDWARVRDFIRQQMNA